MVYSSQEGPAGVYLIFDSCYLSLQYERNIGGEIEMENNNLGKKQKKF